MSRPNRLFQGFSWPQAADAASREGATLVRPLGACEQHGPQLPLSTDTVFAEKILLQVLDQLPDLFPIWMLPAQSLGFSPEHSSFSGTISLSSRLMFQLINEVGIQLAEMGFKRLIFFNSHGGQIGLLQAASRELRVQCPSMSVLPCFLWHGVETLRDLIPEVEIEEGLHAGLAETSLMLSLMPDLVGPERPVEGGCRTIASHVSPPKGWSLEGAAPCAWLSEDLTESGVIGDSRDANASLGGQIQQALIAHWVALFTSLLESNWPPISPSKKFRSD